MVLLVGGGGGGGGKGTVKETAAEVIMLVGYELKAEQYLWPEIGLISVLVVQVKLVAPGSAPGMIVLPNPFTASWTQSDSVLP